MERETPSVQPAPGEHLKAPGRAADPGRRPDPEWAELPEAVRTAVVAVTARVLGAVPAERIPQILAPVARFTPGKRARRGALPIAKALRQDAGFRALVAQHLPPEYGRPGSEAAAVAARAYLLHLPDLAEAVGVAARAEELAAAHAQVAELTRAVETLSARLAERETRLATSPSRESDAERRHQADQAEIAKLRQRLRDQGARIKQAEQAAEGAVADARAAQQEAIAEAARHRAEAETWRARAEAERQRADAAHRASRRAQEAGDQRRADADRRITLLLETVREATEGLQREWHLTAGGADPAEVVARALPAVEPRPDHRVDAALLVQWLMMPGAHLIVDGYNVTKTGYPDLPLADQRDRLIRALGPLAARTGAEITVVFDGAAVVAASPSTVQVRVMFSPPGVLADDVIRQLAEAEPVGRVVVVVTSDREVVDAARRVRARTAPSAVLLEVVG